MSSTKGYFSNRIIDTGDLSGNILSKPVDISRCNFVGAQFHCGATGTPVGTITFEAMTLPDGINSASTNVPPDVFWITLNTFPTTISVNGATDLLVDFSNIPYHYIRARYTRVSGSGSGDLWISGKYF